MITQSVAKS